ncbi:MAG: sulfate/molybdate ABC transporter ATP-binding protein [Mycobacterium sp.]
MADLEVSATVEERGVDVSFGVSEGEVLAVLGPNGAGKSTTASVVAGLLRADRAAIRVGPRTLTDTARGVHVPVHDRRVGVLMQDPLLFPHLSVRGNVLFAAGRRDDGRTRARLWLERVGAAGLSDRRPAELSGGEAQRVALARALAAEPEVLLLDEPLAGLDVAAAASVRRALRDVLGQGGARPVVLVTHDLLDVVGLADRVLVMECGRIVESGSVADVLAAPRSAFGARIAGVNLVRGVVTAPGALRTAGGQTWHGLPAEPLPAGADAVAVFSPASVAVYTDQPHGSPRNSVRAPVASLEVAGPVVRVRAAAQPDGWPGLAADITPEAVAELGLIVDFPAWFTVKTQEVSLHAASRR